jgi:hypothetical protein
MAIKTTKMAITINSIIPDPASILPLTAPGVLLPKEDDNTKYAIMTNRTVVITIGFEK